MGYQSVHLKVDGRPALRAARPPPLTPLLRFRGIYLRIPVVPNRGKELNYEYMGLRSWAVRIDADYYLFIPLPIGVRHV